MKYLKGTIVLQEDDLKEGAVYEVVLREDKSKRTQTTAREGKIILNEQALSLDDLWKQGYYVVQ